MRFPDSFLEEIRARLPASQVVGRRVKLRKQGREFAGLSPFNGEKTPSFFVNDSKGKWFDFSAGRNGDIFSFVMETEGLSFPEAVERLAKEARVPMPLDSKRAKERVMEGFYADMPDDPELAFLFLEELFREQCEAKIAATNHDTFAAEECLQYISQTLAAKTALGLEILEGWKVPTADSFVSDVYRDFRTDVEHVRTILQIRHSRRARALSVRLDDAAKRKLRHHLQQMREIVDKLEISDEKREALYARLNDLQKEIDRDRTRFEVFGAFLVGFGDIFGETTERAGLNRLLVNIARVFSGAKHQEDSAQLPPPPTRKRIEGPKKETKRSLADELEDEIPF